MGPEAVPRWARYKASYFVHVGVCLKDLKDGLKCATPHCHPVCVEF